MIAIRNLKTYSNFHAFVILFLIALAYFALGKLGDQLAVFETYITPVWPGAGFAVAMVLLFGYRSLYALFVGAFAYNFSTLSDSLVHGVVLWLGALTITVGNVLQAAACAWLINWWIPHKQYFEKGLSVIKFILAGILTASISGGIGALTLSIGGLIPWNKFLFTWATWWAGDASGVTVVAPLVLSLLTASYRNLKLGEALLLVCVVVGITYINSSHEYQFTYLYLPCLVWAALRFQLLGVTFFLTLIVAIVIWQTVNGVGPFGARSLEKSLMQVELFVIIISATILILVAELHRYAHETQTLWKASGSSEHFSHRMRYYFRHFIGR